jgi:hypothetical protein
LAYEYAQFSKNDSLMLSIQNHSKRFFVNDINCPFSWEPSGTDFLSPCMEELHLMQQILPKDEYASFKTLQMGGRVGWNSHGHWFTERIR